MADSRHTLPRAPSAQRHKMAHPWLSSTVYELLELEARRRDLHVDVLAAKLIETIVAENLCSAVLDR